jgi:ribonuclease BN (tRNA processing enzyme)
VKLTVVGCSGTYPTAEAPCSGYLFEAAGFRLLVDLGPGTFVELQRYLDIHDLDAILLTHWHPDHVVDIFPLYYALRFSNALDKRLPLYAPDGAERSIYGFLSGDSRTEFLRVFDLRKLEGGEKLELGPFEIETAVTNHPVATVAVLVSADHRSLAYSADTGPGGGFPAIAEKGEILLCEATYLYEGQGPPIHLASRQAAEIAEQAGARRLILTHRFPSCDEAIWLEEAQSVFSGHLEPAKPGLEIAID